MVIAIIVFTQPPARVPPRRSSAMRVEGRTRKSSTSRMTEEVGLAARSSLVSRPRAEPMTSATAMIGGPEARW